jgi:hypothetical protein
MPVNETSNNQVQADIIYKYDIQRKQRNQQPQQQIQQKEEGERNNPASEDVKVTLSRQGRAETVRDTENTADVEARRKTKESTNIENIESRRAIQAYQNPSRADEGARPENARQRQINRIVG